MMIMMVKDTYELVMANRGFLISSINDTIIRFATKVLSCKMLCKLQLNQCMVGAVALVELCIEGF